MFQRSTLLYRLGRGMCLRHQSTVATASAIPSTTLSEPDIRQLFTEIHRELDSGLYNKTELGDMAKYYFDGKGKAIRPVINITLGHAVNHHLSKADDTVIAEKQRKVAMMSEMIHTASLVHDDILDHADLRRGKLSINAEWDIKRATMCGDYILSIVSIILARLDNVDVMIAMSKVLRNLVHGEFQQLLNKKSETERFQLYLSKTFNKTASLIAYSCKAVSILADPPKDIIEASFQYGRNIGIAFQLVDDLLDFESSSEMLGKPAANDLHLGLATAPVLFASTQFRELEAMIDRRFSEPGDVEAAFEAVMKSDGLLRTRELARNHCEDAIKAISIFNESPHKNTLLTHTDKVLNRLK